jgi:hypothetical protein
MHALIRIVFSGAVLIRAFLPTPATAGTLSYEFAGKSGDARQWLQDNGFVFRLDNPSPAQTKYAFTNGGLTIDTLRPANSVVARALNNDQWVTQPAQVVVRWGVKRYPRGADWDHGPHREAIMVVVSFGAKRFALPEPSPYFIGFFLCKGGQLESAKIPAFAFRQTARYMCVASPVEGTEIPSTINLVARFHDAFGANTEVPPVSGIGFEVDTTDLATDVTSSGWVRSVRIGPR